jgi:diacylglycerol kinase
MKSRIEAFIHALQGGRKLLETQPHARFHGVTAVVVFVTAGLCRVTTIEWALLILCVMTVWVAEAINTAIEFLADEVSLEWRERIKHAKDIAAFAVVCAAIGSVTVGAIVFGPYFFRH